MDAADAGFSAARTLREEGAQGSVVIVSRDPDPPYDRTAVSHALVDLVREGTLFRDGTMRNYRYVQKRPLEPQGA